MEKPYIVGITGGSASGKTYFLRELLRSFSAEEICLVSQDNYYKPRHEQPLDENGVHNFDTPQSIDHEQFANDLAALKKGQKVVRQEYTFNNPNAVAKQLEFHPAPVIVAEGIFVFYFPDLTRQLDLKIFIEAEEHIKLSRRIMRDKVERGYDLDDVLYRYERHVAPTYNKYIKPFRSEADLVVPNNHGFDSALQVIKDHLKSMLS